MDRGLSRSQAQYAVGQFQRWLGVKELFQRNEDGSMRYEDGELTDIQVDIMNSPLLMSMLQGVEPSHRPEHF